MSSPSDLHSRIAALEHELSTLKQQLAGATSSPSTQHTNDSKFTYASAGVNIDNGDSLVQNIKPLAKSTYRPGVPNKDEIIGGFGGLFDLKQLKYKDPLLVAGTDGVGTKLEIAKTAGNHTTIGIDLVAMSINDILVQGAEPLFFLDYYATSKLDVSTATAVLQGVTRGCIESNCALIGGETAEMPGLYQHEDYDLAGFGIGIVERHKLLPKMSKIRGGNVLIGLRSSGMHSNGFSLVRRVIKQKQLDVCAAVPQLGNQRLIDVLLTPTKLYVKPLMPVLQSDDDHAGILALAHITGGGLIENIPRVLPANVQAVLDCSTWSSESPAVFKYLQAYGVEPLEMARTYNCGIGMLVVVEADKVDSVLNMLKQNGESDAVVIGKLQDKTGQQQPNVVLNNLDKLFSNAM